MGRYVQGIDPVCAEGVSMAQGSAPETRASSALLPFSWASRRACLTPQIVDNTKHSVVPGSAYPLL